MRGGGRTETGAVVRAAMALGLLTTLISCSVSIDYSGVAYLCEEDGLCPPGQQCVAGACQSEDVSDPDGQAPPDASSPTACVQAPDSCGVALCIPNTVCPVVVDGVLDEFVGAPSIVYQLPSGGNTVTVRAMWDSTALYIGYEIEDTNLTGIETANDADNWLDDCVHWFLDGEHDGGPGPDGRYMLDDDYHGVVNLLGARYDEQGSDATPDSPNTAWNSDEWLSAVTVDGTLNDEGDTDGGMAIEVKVPWSTVGLLENPSDMTLLGLGLAHSDTDGPARSTGLWGNLDATYQNASNWQTVMLRATQ